MNIRATTEMVIGGEKRTLKFGINATALFCDMHDLSLEQFSERFERMKIGDIRDLVYCAIKAGNGNTGEFTAFHVGEWLDDDGVMEQVLAFLNTIGNGEKPKGKKAKP